MDLIRKDEGDGEDKVEFYTVVLTGQSGMSQSGLAILAGVSRTTIQNIEKTLATSAPSEFLEPFVGRSLTLATSDDDVTVDGKPVGNIRVYRSNFCAAVLRHYSDVERLEVREQRPATYSLLRFAEIGIDRWIQDITGWRQWQSTIKPYTDVYIRRIEHMRDHRIDDDLWAIFREAAELLLLIEKDWRVLPVNDYDLLDGSIGRRWSDYRRDKEWAGEIGSYVHVYRDQRGERECNAYEVTELRYFKKWLREIYVPVHLPQYLVDKYGKSAARLIYTENGLLTDEILELTEVKRKAPADEEKFKAFQVARQKLLGQSKTESFE